MNGSAEAPRSLLASLDPVGSPAAGALIGIEHEYRVLDGSGRQVDFRALLHTLRVDGRRLDPGDANAYRLASGLALTADEAEAEVATPPVAVAPGFTPRAAALASEARASLEALLPAGLTLEGYSTHISVSVPDADVAAVAARYARVYAPAFAALAERPGSLGIYVRPRPGRLELCADYIEPARLPPVLALAAGTVRACFEEVRTTEKGLAPLAIDLHPARERPGHRVHRHLAFGFDLYAAGRHASLPLARGGTTTLGHRLAAAAHLAEQHLGTDIDAASAARLRAIVRGDAPLGIEGGEDIGDIEDVALPPQSGWRPAARAFRRPRFEVTPVLATWDFTVFRLDGPRRAYASVPLAGLEAFERNLLAGRLDDTVGRFLAQPPAGRMLQTPEGARRLALYDDVTSDPTALLPREPGSKAASRGAPGRFGKPARPGKVTAAPPLAAPAEPPPPPPPERPQPPAPLADDTEVRPPSRPWRPIAIVAAAVLAVVVAVSAVAVLGADDTSTGGAATTTASVPTRAATSTPSATPAPTPTAPTTVTVPAAATSTAPAGATSPAPTATATASASGGATTPATVVTTTPSPAPTASSTPRPTDTPAPTPSTTATAVATAAPTPTATPSPTATATPSATPTSTPLATPSIRNATCTSVDRNVASTCQLFMGDTGPEATSITWQAPGATPASGTGATFHPVYTTAGDHLVTVTVCAGAACVTRTVTVRVL